MFAMSAGQLWGETKMPWETYLLYCKINGVGYTLKLQESVTVITPELGYGNTGVDGSK